MVEVSAVRGAGARRQQLPEEVAAYVRELIISGEVRPGEFLRMEPIAEAVGVSNTPVREGLLSLRSEGFVELVPRRGFVVASFTRQDVRDLFWAQAQLAGELAARAAKAITPDQLAVLEANVADYEKAFAAGDQEQVADLGHQFHRQINLAADSHRLALLLGTVVSQLPNRFYAQIEGHVGGTRQAHPLILDAIRKRASRQARSLISEHLREGGDQLVAMLEERGMWAEAQTAS
ncbi:GntR family transcriptional regulator [Amycolatopsis sp. K13G38]|uniref:GntR family transcriptional regulator n=1 Tax=Amycolatopsis acididurans TaxID=2724524 RepID=A0ABX1JAE9_9PSEU|nr:GntR family transcriptional regulator [Amycolatopsis acididurans]NKQ55520.1 GntR family transcriptional regulator [Amycolatopsis acididurans]